MFRPSVRGKLLSEEERRGVQPLAGQPGPVPIALIYTWFCCQARPELQLSPACVTAFGFETRRVSQPPARATISRTSAGGDEASAERSKRSFFFLFRFFFFQNEKKNSVLKKRFFDSPRVTKAKGKQTVRISLVSLR